MSSSASLSFFYLVLVPKYIRLSWSQAFSQTERSWAVVPMKMLDEACACMLAHYILGNYTYNYCETHNASNPRSSALKTMEQSTG